MPRPDVSAVGDDAGVELLKLLRCWYWERPKIDPICCSASSPARRSAERSTGAAMYG
jgi:hypothetical protein